MRSSLPPRRSAGAFSSHETRRIFRPACRASAFLTLSNESAISMCGIIGIVGKEEVADRLVDGLRRMEYRGYDSAGICTLQDGQLIRRRAEGKLVNLVRELAVNPAPGTV